MKRRSTVFLVLLMLLGWVLSAQATDPVKRRLLLQVSEDNLDRMMVALNNAIHVKEHYGPENVDVAIVVFNAGVQTLKYYAPIPLVNRWERAHDMGIDILVCEQSLRNAKLKPAEMLPNLSYVPGGIVEIMERPADGWAYVRP